LPLLQDGLLPKELENMSKKQGSSLSLPVKGKLAWIYASSSLIALLMAVVSFAGLRYRNLVYTSNGLMRAFVPNDVVNLLIGLPILLGCMGLAWRGKLIGLLCWIGALLFVLYNFFAYLFAMPFGWTFPGYLALVVLSLYTLIGLVAAIDEKAVQQRLGRAVPGRFAGGVLAGLGLLLFLRVIGVILNALTSGDLPAETELAASLADFLITPAWFIGGTLLWRRSALGYVTGLGLLFQGSLLFIALIIFLLLQPFLTSAPFSIADVIVIFAIGMICFIPCGLFARAVLAGSKKSPT
jgi:hypothetical protein